MVDKSVADMNTEEKINWIYNDKMGFQSLKIFGLMFINDFQK